MADSTTAPAFDLRTALQGFLLNHRMSFPELLGRYTIEVDLARLRANLDRSLAHVPPAERPALVRAAALGFVEGLAACLTEAQLTQTGPAGPVH